MSETPRNDESPEFRDPTAPSDPTQQVPTSGETQHLPSGPEPTEASAPPAPAAPESPEPGYGPPSGAPASAPENPYGAPPSQPAPPQSPYGAPQNPYGAPPPGAQNPYGAPPPAQQYPGQQAGGYGPGYAAPPMQYAQPRSMSGNTIALLVVSGLATLGCGFGIVPLVFAIIAATKTQEPDQQAKFTRWGWWAFGITLLLVIIAAVAIFAFAISTGSSTYDSTY